MVRSNIDKIVASATKIHTAPPLVTISPKKGLWLMWVKNKSSYLPKKEVDYLTKSGGINNPLKPIYAKYILLNLTEVTCFCYVLLLL